MAENIEATNETPRGTPRNTEDTISPRKWLKNAIIVVSILNFLYVVAIAVLIGILKGWPYAAHCFILCPFILFSFAQTVKARTELLAKSACWLSCSTLVMVLMTTFTLLTRQAYYYPSKQLESKWVLFACQTSIVPLLFGMLVMYEFKLVGPHQKRSILIITILNFADIWDMVSILSTDKAPFINEETPLEITMQFFCSLSFIIFSVLVFKNIEKQGLRFMFVNEAPRAQERNEAEGNPRRSIILEFAISNSPLYINIPFLIIRCLVLHYYNFLDFDFLVKNSISVIVLILTLISSCYCTE